MTLTELAIAAGASPKWVLNAAASIRLPKTRSMELARHLAIARTLQVGARIPLPRAFTMARDALRAFTKRGGGAALVTVRGDRQGAVNVVVDVYRILSEVNTRESFLRTMYAPRRRGPRPRRPSTPHQAIQAATDYGWDVTLLESGPHPRTVSDRIRTLDGMAEFSRDARASLAKKR